MGTTQQVQPRILPTLLAWTAYKISHVIASMKPEQSAADMVWVAARSGNPAGG